ncbi:MAG TPA: arsinothricin resistance N-acetyltransferase ArsN1 family B [Solirubrobacterales bacterium]|nr:arsinothricin resistance N-acetyltransferase ArsN1 family B [Solirubrobacterales bacterium]
MSRSELEPTTIRTSDPARDAAACAAIYAPFVDAGATSFEKEAPDAAAFAARIAETQARFPWLVAERDGVVAGYAYACPHRYRPAYRWAVETSVYIAEDQRHSGLGRALYAELIERLRRQRFHVACAGITLPNRASVALHESIGFVPVGVYRRIGWKDGAWRDVGWWQLELQPAGEQAPAEPLPPES